MSLLRRLLTKWAGAPAASTPEPFVRPANDPPIDALISSLGLVADSRPMRANPLWRPPTKVLVTGATSAMLDWLAPVAPGVRLVAIEGARDGLREVADADAIIGWFTPEMIANGTQLVWLQIHTAGVENALHSQEIAERGLVVTNLKRVAGPVIAEHVFAMLLALRRGLPKYILQQRRRRWAQALVPERELDTLRGRALLVVGLGGIGTEVARLAHAFGMRVIAVRSSSMSATLPFVERIETAEALPALLGEADVVVNALPLTPQTAGLFNRRSFDQMKRSSIFVNVARGGSVVTEDLTRALRDRRIAGAALDVTDPEPLPASHPLWRLDNVLITPHVAGVASDTPARSWRIIRENLRRYVQGEPLLSLVVTERGY
jgi:phosphoglycerate dehydrogenase-like enzyme